MAAEHLRALLYEHRSSPNDSVMKQAVRCGLPAQAFYDRFRGKIGPRMESSEWISQVAHGLGCPVKEVYVALRLDQETFLGIQYADDGANWCTLLTVWDTLSEDQQTEFLTYGRALISKSPE